MFWFSQNRYGWQTHLYHFYLHVVFWRPRFLASKSVLLFQVQMFISVNIYRYISCCRRHVSLWRTPCQVRLSKTLYLKQTYMYYLENTRMIKFARCHVYNVWLILFLILYLSWTLVKKNSPTCECLKALQSHQYASLFMNITKWK